MNKNNCYCVIMAGGSGIRFWPVSRASRPKQFLDVADTGKTFIRQTYERFLKIIPQENILVVTADKYGDLVMEQIPELDKANLLLEPYSRNTAPCIAYATYKLLKKNPDATVIVSPSDHIIGNDEIFTDTINYVLEYVDKHDVLMTLGVVPTRPDTNFGYVQAYGRVDSFNENEPVKVKTFTEKPDKELAKIFMNAGEFFWNSGIFLWKGRTIQQEMEKYLPEVTGLFDGWDKAIGTAVEGEFVTRAYTDAPNVSIDYGVMEKTDRAWVYPVKFDWQDIGTWESLYNYMPADDNCNSVSAGKMLMENCSGNMIVSPDKNKLIAIKGLEDFIVIDTEDALVICPRDDKKFKELVSGIAMPEFEKYR